MIYSSSGLSVAYLSGRRSTNSQQYGVYSQDDIDSLRALIEEPGIVDIFLTYPSNKDNISMNGAFIFLVYFNSIFPVVIQSIPCSFPLLYFTNEWPSGVTNTAASSGVPSGMLDSSIGDSNISELVAEIKPR